MRTTSGNHGQAGESAGKVTGVILAGGKSARYGRNKAFVRVDGVPLIERVLGVMASVFENLLVVTNTPEEYSHLKVPMVKDLIKGIGPMGGIYTGLESIRDPAGFFVACDMPYLNARLLRHMSELREDYDAVMPRIKHLVEPLHSIYTRASLGTMKRMIDAGRYQIFELLSSIRVFYVEEEELRAIDPQLRCFTNVNRPEDLAEIVSAVGRNEIGSGSE